MYSLNYCPLPTAYSSPLLVVGLATLLPILLATFANLTDTHRMKTQHMEEQCLLLYEIL